MHRVVVLALHGVYPFELSIPVRIFGTATGPDGEPLYEVLTCSVDGRPVATSADFAVAVQHGAEVVDTAQTLVLPPFVRTDGRRGLAARTRGGGAAPTAARRPDRIDLHRLVRAGGRGPARRATGDDPLEQRRAFPAHVPQRERRRGRAVHRRR
ncbi:hypothetical protein ACFQX7_36395 [Luedemannella flava]